MVNIDSILLVYIDSILLVNIDSILYESVYKVFLVFLLLKMILAFMVRVLPIFFLTSFESYRRRINASRLYLLVLVLVINGLYRLSLLGYMVSTHYDTLNRNILVYFLLKVNW